MLPKYKTTEFAEGSAPFNMALNTLERIGEILRELKDITKDAFMSDPDKQKIKVGLIKQLFYHASPLLKEDIVDKYKEDIYSLKPVEFKIVENKGGGYMTDKGKKVVFSSELDIKLDNFCIIIQRELQREKYFMPPKTDPRFSWRQD